MFFSPSLILILLLFLPVFPFAQEPEISDFFIFWLAAVIPFFFIFPSSYTSWKEVGREKKYSETNKIRAKCLNNVMLHKQTFFYIQILLEQKKTTRNLLYFLYLKTFSLEVYLKF